MLNRWSKTWKLMLVVPIILSSVPLQAQIGSDQDFQCFPSCSEVDSRMLSLGGTALNTVAGFEIAVGIVVDSDASSFEIGIFDGDTGKDAFGVVNGNPVLGTWDQGTDELTYNLFADPDGDGTGTFLVAQWMGNSVNTPSGLWTSTQTQMPDNDWFNAVITTSEDARNSVGQPFRYRMQIENPAPAVVVSSSFKLRVTGGMTVRSSDAAWGIQSSVRASGGPTARIIYPQWNGLFTLPTPDFFLTTPTTYDGSFTFTFEVAPGADTLTIFNGDFDHGALRVPDPLGNPDLDMFEPGRPSGAAMERCFETDDPNSSGVPPFVPLANPEGAVNIPIPPNFLAGGNPPDDSVFDIFRRTPCVVIDVVDPNGTVYRDANPSGNFEWEQIVITSLAAGPSVADYSATFAADGATFVSPGLLPAGAWRLIIRGLDVGNTVFLNGPDVSGIPSARIGDRVWLDRDNDGVQDDPADEPGINGVVVRLYRDDGDGIFNPNPNPGMAFGFDTLVREETTTGDGDYLFEGLGGGDYWVEIPSLNAAGGSPNPAPLFGAEQTFDFDLAPDNLTMVQLEESGEFREADFGYRFGPVGDLVWVDHNEDGMFQPFFGEFGVPGVRVLLEGDLNGDGFPETLETFTDGDGLYLFNDNPFNPACRNCGLPEGDYTVTVAADNFNVGGPLEGARQTFDFDCVGVGGCAPGSPLLDDMAMFNLSPTGNLQFLDADFGYVYPCAECDGKVTQLTLRYLGSTPGAIIRVQQKKGEIVFNGPVEPGQAFTFFGVDKKNTLGTEIRIFVNDAFNASIHTSCSQPIGPGLIRGDFVVVDGFSRNNGRICPLDMIPSADCGECKGKVTQLTLEYLGSIPNANVVVIQKKNDDVVFDGIVNPGDQFTFNGTDGVTLSTEIRIFVNGALNTTIHTSCSQPIGPGLVRGDFEVVEGFSKDGGRLCPLDDMPMTGCKECKGKVRQLTLEYLGLLIDPFIEVVQKNGATVFNGVVNTGGQFTFFGTDSGTFGTEIRIFVNGMLQTTIHTSCSQPIGPGLVRGDFLVVEGFSKDNGLLCPVDTPPGGDPPPAGCSECDGKVTQLTLEYQGLVSNALIRVEQKKGGAVVFEDLVNPGQAFTFAGADKKGTLGTEIQIFVNGMLQTAIHTSCSQPIGPGLVFGDFLVVEGFSRNGGRICPIPGSGGGSQGADACERKGKPSVVALRYVGGSCSASANSQDPKKAPCQGDAFNQSPVRVLATDKKDPLDTRGKVWADQTVALGQTFELRASNAGEDRLKSQTYIHILDLQGNPLQSVGLHTSCSQPLIIGEQFGGLVVEAVQLDR